MAIKIQNNYTTTLSQSAIYGFVVLFLIVWGDVTTLRAQADFKGVFQNYLAAQTTDNHEFIAARNRLRIQFNKPTDFGKLQTELDLIHKFNQSQEIEFQLKEVYLEWFLKRADLRIGHQKIIWGRANGTFITDIITPVDLRGFLTISAEDIRFGVTSFNAIRYFGENSLQFVVAPFFQRDLLPTADSRWFPARQLSSVFSPISITSGHPESEFNLEDVQAALRYNLLSPDFADLDLFLMRWTHPTPAYDLSIETGNSANPLSLELVESYQSAWMAGISSTIKIHPDLFVLGEALFVEKKLFARIPLVNINELGSSADLQDLIELVDSADLSGGFLTSKPWIHSMVGFRTEILKTTIDAQFFIEGIFDYDEKIIQKEIYKYATLLAARSFLRERLQLLALSRYNTDTRDFWIQFQGQYELTDNLQLTLGTNLFGGKKSNELSGHLSFSQFRDNSFIFSKIALYF